MFWTGPLTLYFSHWIKAIDSPSALRGQKLAVCPINGHLTTVYLPINRPTCFNLHTAFSRHETRHPSSIWHRTLTSSGKKTHKGAPSWMGSLKNQYFESEAMVLVMIPARQWWSHRCSHDGGYVEETDCGDIELWLLLCLRRVMDKKNPV